MYSHTADNVGALAQSKTVEEVSVIPRVISGKRVRQQLSFYMNWVPVLSMSSKKPCFAFLSFTLTF